MRWEYAFDLQVFGGDDTKKKLLVWERKKKKRVALDDMTKGHIQKGEKKF